MQTITVLEFNDAGEQIGTETQATFTPANADELKRFFDGESPADITASRIDFYFENHGSIVLLHTLTDAAQEHADDVFPDALYMGAAIAVEPRFASDLIYRLHNDGFKVCAFGQEILEITPR